MPIQLTQSYTDLMLNNVNLNNLTENYQSTLNIGDISSLFL